MNGILNSFDIPVFEIPVWLYFLDNSVILSCPDLIVILVFPSLHYPVL